MKWHMAAAMLSVLGGFSLPDGSGTLTTRKDRLLLCYLALHGGRPQPREKLCTLLWGDRAEAQARGSLRQSLAAIRDAFRPLGKDPLGAGRDAVSYDPGVIGVDALAFERASAEPHRLADALSLYGGELLSGTEAPSSEFAAWLGAERTRFEDIAARLCEQASRATVWETAQQRAADVAQGLVRRDALREQVWRALMRLHLLRDERTDALKAYASCRDALAHDLKVSPGFETEQLYRDILAGPLDTHRDGRAERPAIAVMPLENISGDPGLPQLCEGLAEEIITGLGRFRLVDVVDRNSSSAVARSHTDAAEIGARLGATMIVQGSLQRLGQKMRITMRLVDASSRRQLTGESFECPADELLAMPDYICRGIVTTLHHKVEASLIDRSRRKPKLQSYEALLRGVRHLRGYAPDDNALAMKCFEEAVALDRGHGLALAYKAFGKVVLHGYDAAPRSVLDEAFREGNEAVAMDPNEARSYWLLGLTTSYRGDFAAETRLHERALMLNPYDANVLASYGVSLAATGRPEDGVAKIREAMRLNPYHPEWYWLDLGSALFLMGHYAEALEAYQKRANPLTWLLVRIAACYAKLGQMSEASAVVADILRREPGFRLSQHRTGSWGPADTQRFREAMLLAGLPE